MSLLAIVNSQTKRGTGMLFLASLVVFGQAAFGSVSLEGHNKGDTNWYTGNLMNRAEWDFIPCRVHVDLAHGNNQTISVFFEHYNNGIPGIQNLFYWSASSNVVFTAAPVLSAPPSASTWSYTFTINILDNQPAYVWYFARLAAGAHLNVGSSLTMSGKPSSMGNLQLHKPSAAPEVPNLAVVKSG